MGREPVIVVRHEDGDPRAGQSLRAPRLDGVRRRARQHASASSALITAGATTAAGELQGGAVLARLCAGASSASCGSRRCRASRPIAASSSPPSPRAAERWRISSAPAKASFDDLVDRAPGGELEVAGGVFKHTYNGNWKLMLENHLDGAHPAWVHASSVAVARSAPEPGKPGESTTPTSRCGRCARTARPTRCGKRPACGPRRAATATWATTTTTTAWSPASAIRCSTSTESCLMQSIGEKRSRPHPARHALEHDRLPELLVHEPVPAAAHHPSARGGPLGGLHVLVPHEAGAGADVPRHGGVRQRGERHRLLGADRRPRGLRAHPARPLLGRGGMGLRRPRLRRRRRRMAGRCAARPAPARYSSARRCAHGSTT